MKIQKRLVISFAVLSLIPLLITGLVAYHQSSVAIKDKISTYSVQVLNQMSINIQNELSKLENDSIDIAFSDIVQNRLMSYSELDAWERNAAEQEMKTLVSKRFSFVPSVTDVQIFTKNREKIIAYGDFSFGYKLRSDFLGPILDDSLSKGGVPIWTIQSKENEEDWRDYSYRASLYGDYGILLARSFRSLKEGTSLGYILIRIDERHILNKYKDIDLGTGTDIFILDEYGKVVSSRTSEIETASIYDEFPLIEQINHHKNNDIYTFQATISGKRYLVTYSLIPQANWILVSTIPFSYLNQESVRIGIFIAILGIICFLLAWLLSLLVSKSISKPLTSLIGSMKHVKAGNFPLQIRDDSYDELGVVSEHFNSMVHDLKFLIEELKQKETLKREAELKALQAQINPHFLSNTLNTIRWLANLQGADNISKVIHSLIQLLHASMWEGGELITIKEEIEYVKHYLNIMTYKYYDKFSVHYELEEEVLNEKILKFLLQPIVENSVLHGIEPMNEHGTIVIKAYRIEEQLKITITDNGVGIQTEEMAKLMQRRQDVQQVGSEGESLSGFGIWNVDQRIKLYFGEDYGLTIQSVPNLFTTIELTIPTTVHKEENQNGESADCG